MAKKSKIAKNLQRMKLVAKYAERRAELVKVLKDPNASFEDSTLLSVPSTRCLVMQVRLASRTVAG